MRKKTYCSAVPWSTDGAGADRQGELWKRYGRTHASTSRSTQAVDGIGAGCRAEAECDLIDTRTEIPCERTLTEVPYNGGTSKYGSLGSRRSISRTSFPYLSWFGMESTTWPFSRAQKAVQFGRRIDDVSLMTNILLYRGRISNALGRVCISCIAVDQTVRGQCTAH